MKNRRRMIRVLCILLMMMTFIFIQSCDTNSDNNNGDDNNDDDPTGIAKWSLWSEGTKLRGINIWQRKVYPELDGNVFMGTGYCGPPYSQDDFNRLAGLGANYVNISHPGLYTENPPYQVDQQVQQNLDNLLSMIEQADMFAVISFRTGPGRSEFTFYYDDTSWFSRSYFNENVWKQQAAQNGWVEMWKYVANRYKDSGIVVGYDLMVEPNSNEALYDIWDPDEFYSKYRGTLADWNPFHTRISAAIRGIDSDTPILIGGNAYSSVEWLSCVEVNNSQKVIYTIHQYDPFVYTHQEYGGNMHSYPGRFDTNWDGTPDDFNSAWIDSHLKTVDQFRSDNGNVPIAVNEYGVVRWVPGAARFMDDQINYFEQRGYNYAHWVWNPSYAAFSSEVDEFDMMQGNNPNNHSLVTTSALIEVMKKYWAKNNDKPSNTEFE